MLSRTLSEGRSTCTDVDLEMQQSVSPLHENDELISKFCFDDHLPSQPPPTYPANHPLTPNTEHPEKERNIRS